MAKEFPLVIKTECDAGGDYIYCSMDCPFIYARYRGQGGDSQELCCHLMEAMDSFSKVMDAGDLERNQSGENKYVVHPKRTGLCKKMIR